MALHKSKTAAGQVPVASLMAALVSGIVFEFVTTATPLAAGDIIQLGPIEAGVKPVEFTFVTDDLDVGGAPTITLSVGILNAAGTDLDVAATSTWLAASNIGQTGGLARAANQNAYLSGSSKDVRQLGVKVVAGPQAGAGAGKRLAVVLYAAG